MTTRPTREQSMEVIAKLKSLGIRQKQIAAVCGKYESDVSCWASGKRIMSADDYRRCHSLLKYEIDKRQVKHYEQIYALEKLWEGME
jgi:transcriptional regulator with XRE-family HTH domain